MSAANVQQLLITYGASTPTPPGPPAVVHWVEDFTFTGADPNKTMASAELAGTGRAWVTGMPESGAGYTLMARGNTGTVLNTVRTFVASGYSKVFAGDIIALADGGCYVAGNTFDNSNYTGSRMFVNRHNADGSLAWSVRDGFGYSRFQFNKYTPIVLTSDGGLLVNWVGWPGSGFLEQTYLSKLTPSGVCTWNMPYGVVPGYSQTTLRQGAIAVGASGDAYAAHYSSFLSSPLPGWVAVTRQVVGGTYVWCKNINYIGGLSEPITQVGGMVVDESANCVYLNCMAEIAPSIPGNPYTYQSYIVCLDATTGALNWTKLVSGNSFSSPRRYSAGVMLKVGSSLLVSVTLGDYSYLALYDTSGALIRAVRIIVGTASVFGIAECSISHDGNGSIVVSGYGANYGGCGFSFKVADDLLTTGTWTIIGAVDLVIASTTDMFSALDIRTLATFNTASLAHVMAATTFSETTAPTVTTTITSLP